MTKRHKRLGRILRGEGSVRYDEMDVALKDLGFIVRQSGKGSSHFVYSHPEVDRLVVLSPHGRNAILPTYQIQKAAQAIREVLEK